MGGCNTREENARELRYDEMNAQVRKFKSRLTRLKNKGDHAGVIALWGEFETWCDANMWPDNWRLWECAKEDAEFALRKEAWVRREYV